MSIVEKRRNALIVEDEVLISAIAADALQELGFDAIEVCSAKAAMDQVRSTHFDLALVDLGLPDRPGDELITDLRILQSNLPLIIATGYCDSAMHDQFRSLRQLVILNKPYDFSQIHAAVAALALR
jgi:DNA-binding response OmpR family regulator